MCLQATYFYGGRAYSEQEWRQAKADGSLYQPAPPETYYNSRTVADDEAMGLGELMAFAGPAPELINGRLAMLAFVSALAAELASGESVLKQWADEPTGVLLGASVLAIGSLFPLIESRRKEAFGIFTPDAEMLNGRQVAHLNKLNGADGVPRACQSCDFAAFYCPLPN